MPGRKVPLVEGFYYHVLNRGIADTRVFNNNWNYKRFLNYIFYYQNINVPGRYSYFIQLSRVQRKSILDELGKEKKFHADLICFCLMPTHFHLLLKQNTEDGISKFLSQITNSYTRYLNSTLSRKGPIFQGTFKAVKINSEEQLMHLSRYIHLNPYSSGLVKDLKDLVNYPYSSFFEYVNLETNRCQKEIILNKFKSKKSYRDFVFDRADYQKELEFIKHLILD